jgi:NADH dehydrogenase
VKARNRRRIVIVGANFAGTAAAQHLDRSYDVTVVDRSPWFEWLPNIHELLSGMKRPADLRLPHSRLVRRAGHRFLHAEVTRIDARRSRVLLTDGRSLGFDACIVAVGGVHDTFGVRGADVHARAFKGVADCAAIGRDLAALRRRRGRGSVVIVGGGLEGVEGLGEILRGERRRRSLDVTLVEAGPRLLPDMPAVLDATVRAHCAGFDVRILTRTRVTAVTPRRVRLDTGEWLRSDLTIWTGGSAPAPLLRASGLAARKGQWAEVSAALQSRRHDNVFVIGDAALLPTPLSKQAYHALDMGRCAADNVVRWLEGRRLRRFRAAPKPMLVAFGDLDTFLVAGRRVLASRALAAAKESVYQVTMTQLDPPLAPAALRAAGSRLRRGVRQLALPGPRILQRGLNRGASGA